MQHVCDERLTNKVFKLLLYGELPCCFTPPKDFIAFSDDLITAYMDLYHQGMAKLVFDELKKTATLIIICHCSSVLRLFLTDLDD